MKMLKQESVLPIIADESCQKLADVSSCAEVFHGINIKLNYITKLCLNLIIAQPMATKNNFNTTNFVFQN